MSLLCQMGLNLCHIEPKRNTARWFDKGQVTSHILPCDCCPCTHERDDDTRAIYRAALINNQTKRLDREFALLQRSYTGQINTQTEQNFRLNLKQKRLDRFTKCENVKRAALFLYRFVSCVILCFHPLLTKPCT